MVIQEILRKKKLGVAILEQIGNTPLLNLAQINREVPHVTLLAKAEWFNPGGSVKDRAAASIVDEAERAGKLTKDKVLLDASSGNTGIAYAMIGAAKGYQVELAIPQNASDHVFETIQGFGASVIQTSPLESSDGAIREARRRVQKNPERYFYADQYNNPANWKAHYKTTGVELWNQTRGAITHLIAGLGTTGTLMGTGKRLKEYNPSIQLVAVQPDSPMHGLEGLKHMATSIVPSIYEEAFPDQQATVQTEDAYGCVKRLAKEEGLSVGISAGAALAASLKLASEITEGTIVMIFPDSGTRYLDEPFWRQES